VKKARGQGSTEYLVILGAVLLVSLVTVSLTGSFPSSAGTTKEQQSKSYWSGTTPFAISIAKVSNSTFSFTVSNKLTERVYLTAIEVQDGSGNNLTIMTPNQVFNAGEEIILSHLNAPNITNSSFNPCYSTGAAKTGKHVRVQSRRVHLHSGVNHRHQAARHSAACWQVLSGLVNWRQLPRR